MNSFIDAWLEPPLQLLADWSLRWAAAAAVVALWFALRPPRRAGARALVLHIALWGGLLLPLAPAWGPTIVRPAEAVPDETPTDVAPIVSDLPPHFAGPPRVAERMPLEVVSATAPPIPATPAGEPAAMAESAEPLGRRRGLLLALGGVWLAGVGVMLTRLVLGNRWLARLRREARPVGIAALAQLAECRRLLGVRRPAALTQHPAVGSPVLLGGRRPLILVPPGWEHLPEPARRASLLHELAHLARRDDWARLGQELVRAAFFFHPLVHWLLARLDCEREQLCDEVVVARGVAPRALARVLFDFARRTAPGRPAALALPLFRRSTLKDRIDHLLEDDVMHWLSPLPRLRALTLSTAVLAGLCAVGGFAVRAVTPEQPAPPAPAAKPDEPKAKPPAAESGVRGVVEGPDGKPVAGATVVFGGHFCEPKPQVVITGADGRYSFPPPRPGPKSSYAASVLAGKDGFAPVRGYTMSEPDSPHNQNLVLKLAKPREHLGKVQDRQGKPIAGARVQFGVVQRWGNSGSSWGCAPYAVFRDTALEKLFSTISDEQGQFRLTSAPADTEIVLRAAASGFADYESRPGLAYDPSAGTAARPTTVILEPECRVRGRVVSRVPGVAVGGHVVTVRESDQRWMHIHQVRTDDRGTFDIGGLGGRKVSIALAHLPEYGPWTAKAVEAALTDRGVADALIEIMDAVKVEGRVVVAGGGPAAGITVLAYSASHPRGGLEKLFTKSDADGRFRFMVPPGEVEAAAANTDDYMSLPNGGGTQKVIVPGDVKTFALPDLVVQGATGLDGRIVDAAGRPVPGAQVVGICRSGTCQPLGGPKVVSDNQGKFSLTGAVDGPFALGQAASLQVVTAAGHAFEVAVVAAKGAIEVRLPTLLAAEVKGPADVKPDELAGVVVDERGRPIPGVEVDAWDWYRGNETKTAADGSFRLGKLGRDAKIQVRFRKPGWSPVMSVQQPTALKGWVVVLDQKTYFEGRVVGPDGKPAANARIRADQGPKQGDGVHISTIWTETTTDADGRYRLYVEPDAYEFHVKAPGVGVARLPRTPIAHGQPRTLDIPLRPGVTFRATVVDSLTGAPVAGVRLGNWQEKDVHGTSDAAGLIAIPEMLPGRFQFDVKAAEHVRWWSPQAASEHSRRPYFYRDKFQDNMDSLEFNLQPDMPPVTITVERGVRFRGKVLDPDGKPVAGATVAPALTGTGNSLTGDTRFSVATQADGTFEVLLPASGKTAEYNLIAHDGKYGQWRNWANGVTTPVRTLPGQEFADVVLLLTRPAVVRGKVVDSAGKPVAHRQVRAHAADRRENRYYDPTATTKEDGTFELRFVRPGEQFIQAAPFWLFAHEAPPASTKKLTLKEGQVVEAVELVAVERE